MNPLENFTNKATIGDVARLAGVSIKTVSRVANDMPHVRDATREKVQRAIDTLNYTANPFAKQLGPLRHTEHEKNGPQAPKTSDHQSSSEQSECGEIDWW